MIEELLKQKDITANEKLILIDLILFPKILPYHKTSIEISHSTGIKQKDIKIALNTLVEKGIITTEVEYRLRKTKITKEFLKTLNK